MEMRIDEARKNRERRISGELRSRAAQPQNVRRFADGEDSSVRRGESFRGGRSSIARSEPTDDDQVCGQLIPGVRPVLAAIGGCALPIPPDPSPGPGTCPGPAPSTPGLTSGPRSIGGRQRLRFLQLHVLAAAGDAAAARLVAKNLRSAGLTDITLAELRHVTLLFGGSYRDPRWKGSLTTSASIPSGPPSMTSFVPGTIASRRTHANAIGRPSVGDRIARVT